MSLPSLLNSINLTLNFTHFVHCSSCWHHPFHEICVIYFGSSMYKPPFKAFEQLRQLFVFSQLLNWPSNLSINTLFSKSDFISFRLNFLKVPLFSSHVLRSKFLSDGREAENYCSYYYHLHFLNYYKQKHMSCNEKL